MGEAPRDIGTGSLLRTVTEQVARDPSAWTPEVARQVGGHFEALSAEWHLHHDPDRIAVLADALDRGGRDGGPRGGGDVVELGAGRGAGTRVRAERFGRVVAVDIEPRMIQQLREAVDRAGITNVEIRLADAYDLPAADASVDVVFMVTVLAEIPDRQRALAEVNSYAWVATGTIGVRVTKGTPSSKKSANSTP